MGFSEFYVLFFLCFCCGILFLLAVIGILLFTHWKLLNEFTDTQKEIIKASQNYVFGYEYFLTVVLWLIHFVITIILEEPRSIYEISSPVHNLVPITFLAVLLSFVYSFIKIHNRQSVIWIDNHFPSRYISFRKNLMRSGILTFSLSTVVFLVGWFILSKIDLMI